MLELIRFLMVFIRQLEMRYLGNQHSNFMTIYRMLELMEYEESSGVRISTIRNLTDEMGLTGDEAVVYCQIESLSTHRHIGEIFATYSLEDAARFSDTDIRQDLMPSVAQFYGGYESENWSIENEW